MRFSHRLFAGNPAQLLLLTAILASALPSRLDAATSVTVLAPANVDAVIAGSTIEDFEDVNLIPGLTITCGTWRNGANAITADAAVVYSGTLPRTWDPAVVPLSNNTWDGSHALVNGWDHKWLAPLAASIMFQFSTPQSSVGIGCSNFQSSETSHQLLVNGVSKGNLEALPGWIDDIVHGKNGYLLFVGGPGDPITSIEFKANTHYDGLVWDKLAIGPMATPNHATTWGRVKSLYR
jgi:hypothetical protein